MYNFLRDFLQPSCERYTRISSRSSTARRGSGRIAGFVPCTRLNVGPGNKFPPAVVLDCPSTLPPRPPKLQTTLKFHAHTRQDPYHWMNPAHTETYHNQLPEGYSAATHLQEESSYLASWTAATANQIQNASKKLGALQPLPFPTGERDLHDAFPDWFSEPTTAFTYCLQPQPGAGGPAICRRAADSHDWQKVLNVSAATSSTYILLACVPSPGERFLAIVEDVCGTERGTLRVLDLLSGQDVVQPIEHASGQVLWSANGRTLFYTVADPSTGWPSVWRSTVGKTAGPKRLYTLQKDPRFPAMCTEVTGIQLTQQGGMMMMNTMSTEEYPVEVRVLRADRPNGDWRLLVPYVQGVQYSVAHLNGVLFVRYRGHDSPNWMVVALGAAGAGGAAGGQEMEEAIVPHRRDVELLHVALGGREGEGVGLMVLVERHYDCTAARWELQAAAYRLSFLQGRALPERSLLNRMVLGFEGPVCEPLEYNVRGSLEGLLLSVVTSSLISPSEVREFDLLQGSCRVLSRQAYSGFSRGRYELQQVWATADDGQRVPITVAFRRDLFKVGGDNPLLLHVYGAYGFISTQLHGFDPSLICLMDAGWVVAAAHVRGGGELGRWWHHQATRLTKQTAVSDLIACGEHLIGQGFTRAGLLCGRAASAGGMLLAAAVNARPELWSCVVYSAAAFDLLTSIVERFGGYDKEFADCAVDEEYRNLAGYCPYDNLVPQRYPAMLVLAGNDDIRVGSWEAMKFVAKAREAGAGFGSGEVLLLVHDGGHFTAESSADLQSVWLAFLQSKVPASTRSETTEATIGF